MKDKPESVKGRQAKRRADLNRIARAAGYSSWTVYETAVIHSLIRLSGYNKRNKNGVRHGKRQTN
jgi:hypothetical protein